MTLVSFLKLLPERNKAKVEERCSWGLKPVPHPFPKPQRHTAVDRTLRKFTRDDMFSGT